MSRAATSPEPSAHRFSPEDSGYMRHALALASRSLGQCWPNPAVGAVIVQAGHVVGIGNTARSGRPHAETIAIEQAGNATRGATLYVTLEPCSHHGQTPPCVDAIIKADIHRVVIACEDAHPNVNGEGIRALQKAGIQVKTGLLEKEAREVNAGFFSVLQKKRPLVTLKLATSLDGKVALANGKSQWITSEAQRKLGHLLRAENDAILTGSGTANADDPMLTCRLPGMEDRSPVRVVADSQLSLSPRSKLATSAGEFPLWVAALEAKDGKQEKNARKLVDNQAKIFALPAKDGHICPHALLQRLAEEGITRLLVESGPTLATTLIKEKLVDRIVWMRGPVVLGNDAIPALGALGYETLEECWKLEPANAGSEQLMEQWSPCSPES